MTIEAPIWLQNGTYPARLDRAFIERVMHGAERVFDGLAVTQASPSANFTVNIAAGAAAIQGDDITNQGMYYVRSTATENVAVPASPGSGSRTDTVIFRIRDGQALGAGPSDAIIEVIEGTTVPDSCLALATIARTAGEPSILNAAITDVRPLGAYPYGVGTAGPPAVGVEGDLYVQVEA